MNRNEIISALRQRIIELRSPHEGGAVETHQAAAELGELKGIQFALSLMVRDGQSG